MDRDEQAEMYIGLFIVVLLLLGIGAIFGWGVAFDLIVDIVEEAANG